MDKVYQKIEEAIADVNDGAIIAIGGFFACGVPRLLLQALIDKKVKNLTLTCGCGPLVGATDELRALVKNGQLKKLIDSYGLARSASKGRQDPFEQAVKAGTIELEVVPMGTLAGTVPRGGGRRAGGVSPHRCRLYCRKIGGQQHRSQSRPQRNAGLQRPDLHPGICTEAGFRIRACAHRR